MKYVLGPLGALILLGIYAWRTETVRLPKLVALLETAQSETRQVRKDCDGAKGKMRKLYEQREEALREQLDRWKARHARENTRRIFWQTTATDIARRNGEEKPEMPRELTRTSMNVPPVPRDPEPDVFDDDDELPPAPDF